MIRERIPLLLEIAVDLLSLFLCICTIHSEVFLLPLELSDTNVPYVMFGVPCFLAARLVMNTYLRMDETSEAAAATKAATEEGGLTLGDDKVKCPTTTLEGDLEMEYYVSVSSCVHIFWTVHETAYETDS